MKKTCFLVFLMMLICIKAFTQQSCNDIIHVTKTGTDQSDCGAEGSPCLTINFAISRAIESAFHNVRVGTGSYAEVVVVKEGINLWGGFDNTWTRTDKSTIAGGQYQPDNESIGLMIEGVDIQTVVSDFDIYSPNSTVPGKSSYSVHIANSNDLILQNCSLYPGNGAPGASGINGISASQTQAPSGGQGTSGTDAGFCDDSRRAGGGGGTNPVVGTQSTGGAGGSSGTADSYCSSWVYSNDYNAQRGLNGAYGSGYGGSGGYGGGLCFPGGNGQNGGTYHGYGGTGGSASGAINVNYWVSSIGGTGSLGLHGGGGGGGGGAGGCDSGTDNTGSGGGGGGAGGARASLAGGGGQGGGSSFGIFIINSTLKLKSCTDEGGNGGGGGNGGNGAPGQPGGNGGAGGFHVYGGGNGGSGGAGGNSGGGGGGAGGSSYCIYGTNSNVYYQDFYTSPGSPGIKGTGGYIVGSAGQDGEAGVAALQGGSGLIISPQTIPVINDPCCVISISEISSLQFCNSDSFEVICQAGGVFAEGNIFTIQLSDNSGSFTIPVPIGKVTSSTSGVIKGKIPWNISPGNTYKLRIVSSDPAIIGNVYDQEVIIYPKPDITINSSATTLCQGGQLTLEGSGATSYQWSDDITDGIPFSPPAGTHIYMLIGTDNQGCRDTNNIEISVNPAPVVVASASSTTLCPGEKLTLTGSGALSYIWDHSVINNVEFIPPAGSTLYTVTGIDANNCSGTDNILVEVTNIDTSLTVVGSILIANANQTSYQWIDCATKLPIPGAVSKAYMVTESGSYAVVVSQNSCVDTSLCYNIIITDISPISENKLIHIYPNPTEGETWIEFDESIQGDISLQIMNMNGQLLFQDQFAIKERGSKRNYNFTELNEGIYIIIIATSEKVHRIKFVKE